MILTMYGMLSISMLSHLVQALSHTHSHFAQSIKTYSQYIILIPSLNSFLQLELTNTLPSPSLSFPINHQKICLKQNMRKKKVVPPILALKKDSVQANGVSKKVVSFGKASCACAKFEAKISLPIP